MKTIERKKTFDCLQMKEDIQMRIYAETKDMDTAELLAYFNRQTENTPYPNECALEMVCAEEQIGWKVLPANGRNQRRGR